MHHDGGNAAASERGVALLITLLSIALLTVVVMEFTFSTQVDYRRAAHWLEARKAALLADSGVTLAEEILTWDALTTQVDGLSELWARILPPIDTGEGVLAIRIEDDTAYYNINRLQRPSAEERQRFARLLLADRIEGNILGPVVDWIDRDDRPLPSPQGAEAAAYAGEHLLYRPRNGPFLTFREIGLVKGVAAAQMVSLRRLVTVLPPSQKRINLNTAPREVLRALHPGMDNDILLDRLLERRQQRPFTSWDDASASIEGLATVPIKTLLDFSSHYFRVRATAQVGDVYQSVEAILHRDSGRIHVIYRLARRGPNITGTDMSTAQSLEDLEFFGLQGRNSFQRGQ